MPAPGGPEAAPNRAETSAMGRAVELARSGDFRGGGNPRVGCVILSVEGQTLGEGWHRGAGHDHAEVMALAGAGPRAHGATAVVTLEPCAHRGRTGPCTRALIDSGIARVVFGQADPDPVAAGGAGELRAAGIEIVGPTRDAGAAELNAMWSVAVARGWPFVLLKMAVTLDGRTAAADGSSRWITGPEARRNVHETRADVDAVMVGTGTVLVDNPALTARIEGRNVRQPVRIVVGTREIPDDARVADGKAPLVQIRTHDPAAALREAHEHGVRSVLLEGGRTLATALLRHGLVDRIDWYLAPAFLGDTGLPVLGDLGTETIGEAMRWSIASHRRLGEDLLLRLVPVQA